MNNKLFAPDPVNDPFGPTPAYSTGLRLDTGVEPDKLVATHCCFCGQQCGILLKVKANEVIGFEPRYDFPLIPEYKVCAVRLRKAEPNGA